MKALDQERLTETVTDAKRAPLCKLADVPDGGGLEAGDAVLVLRRGDDAWAYRNVCPHFSIPLNYEPDTFWAYDASLVMCAHHSAMFRFEDGECVDGPCLGARLTRVPIRIENNSIFIDEGGDIHEEEGGRGSD
jgi:nitrite reductase/ring-hydroxylating ferredoxin subunit